MSEQVEPIGPREREPANVAIVFQVVAGAVLLRGRPGARAFVAVPIVFCILAGTPGKARIATGVILAAVSLLVTVVGSRGSAAEAQSIRGEVRGDKFDYCVCAFADGGRAYRVVAFASPEHFARLREEISGIVRSFRARCATSK
jgi:hypothetical protein